MAKTKGPLFSTKAHGTVSNILTYSTRKSQNIVRHQRKQKDAQSASQLAVRATYQDAITAWKALTEEEKEQYNETAGPLHMSGYNYFLQQYLLNPPTPPTPNPYLKLLCHYNGVDGQQTYTSDDLNARVASFFDGAELDSALKKFGTTSLRLEGAGDYITFPASNDFNFGSGDLTMETFFRISQLPEPGELFCFFDHWQDATRFWTFGLVRDDFTTNCRLSFLVYNSGIVIYITSSFAAYNINQWYHAAVVRSGNNYYLFLDGTLVASLSNSNTHPDITGPLYIGYYVTATYYIGWLDEQRILKGYARWTSDFTPPTQEYTIYDP